MTLNQHKAIATKRAKELGHSFVAPWFHSAPGSAQRVCNRCRGTITVTVLDDGTIDPKTVSIGLAGRCFGETTVGTQQ